MKLLLAGASAAAAQGLLAACRPDTAPAAPTASPTGEIELPRATGIPPAPQPSATALAPTLEATSAPTPTAPAATAAAAQPAGSADSQTLAGQNRKQVWAWLRMLEVGDVPTSEADYRAHSTQIDVAMPLHGGKLQADGTWEQEDAKLNHAWPQSLPGLARKAAQLYMPGMGNDRDGTLKVLGSTSLQERAAADLAKLAKEGRFDSPWDGVYLDIEGISFEYRSQMSGFLFRLARAVKDAGLLLGISVGGVTQESTGTLHGDDAMDLGVIGEIADFVDLRCYDYGGPPPRSIGPYWWIEDCIQYALKKGVRPGQMTAGLATFSQQWPDANAADSEQMTYERALQLVKQANAQVQWMESDENGLVRESYATIGRGTISIADDKSYRYGLGLIDQYRLLGNTMFAPGMGNEAQWQALSTWAAARYG